MADLSPERRQQIEEEERQKHAEEQYRQQIRAGLKSSSEPAPKKSRTPWIILGLALIASPFVISMITRSASDTTASAGSKTGGTGLFAPTVRYVPVSQKIASGQVVIQAGGYVQYKIQITPDMRNAQITGNFNASGGSGNDVDAAIAEESEYTNWINGHQAKVYYSSNGRKTTDRFAVRLGPGTYYFALSNKFSALSQKFVFLDVDLNYSKLETR